MEGADVTRISTEGMRCQVHAFIKAAPDKRSLEIERGEHVGVVDCRRVKGGSLTHLDVVGDVALAVFETNALVFAGHAEGTRPACARCSYVGDGSVNSSVRVL